MAVAAAPADESGPEAHDHRGGAVARRLPSVAGMTKPRDIEPRVFALSVATIRWGRRKPATWINRDLVRQLVRATTSIGANLEEARAAETKKDFIHKGVLPERKPSRRTTGLVCCSWRPMTRSCPSWSTSSTKWLPS